MSLLQTARTAYAERETPARTAKSTEYDLLARATQRLARGWSRRQDDFSALALALNENLKLWASLAADVAEQGNGLPAPLRAQLFYLYEFTASHSRAILKGGASVEVLIDINTAVMRGLRGDGGKT